MFVQYYGLHEDPFSTTALPRYPFLSATHSKALAALSYGLERRLGFQLLVGERGIGKTTILRQLQGRPRDNSRTFFLTAGRYDASALLHRLLSHLGSDSPQAGNGSMQVQVARLLEWEAAIRGPSLLIIDDGHKLDDSALGVLKILEQPDAADAQSVRIVLAGLPEIVERFAPSAFAQFRQCVRIYQLSPAEVVGYIDHRLRMAGKDNRSIFSQDAGAAIAKHSHGSPARINQLCGIALQAGAEHNLRLITATTVESILARDDLHDPPTLLHTSPMTRRIAWVVVLFLIVMAGANLWYRTEKQSHKPVARVTNAAPSLPEHSRDASAQPTPVEKTNNDTTSVETSRSAGDTIAAMPQPKFSPSPRADTPSNVLELPTSVSPPGVRSTPRQASEMARASKTPASALPNATKEKVAVDINAGDVHMRRGEYDRAIDLFRRALAYLPGNQSIEQRIERADRARAAEEKILKH